MAQKLLVIYRTVQTPPQQTVVSQVGNGFDTQAGTLDQVCRVDFFDSRGLQSIFPCDPAKSTIQFGSRGTFVQLNLVFVYLLGTPDPNQGGGAFKQGMDAQLVVAGSDDGPIPAFTNGMFLDGNVVRDGNANIIKDYSSVFNQLKQGTASHSVDASPLSALPAPWPTFFFASTLFYCVRDVAVQGGGVKPVLTLERLIPALHNSILRLLPPPFAIPIALETTPGDLSKISLRATQLPPADWINNADGPAKWIVDVSGFQSGTINAFWQHSVVEPYLGFLASSEDAEFVSMLPAFTGAQNDQLWRLRLPVPLHGDPASPISLQLLGDLDAPAPPSSPVAMACSAFQSFAGAGLSFTAQLKNKVQDKSAFPWIQFDLTNTFLAGGDDGSRVRLGSLDLTFKPPTDNKAWMTCGATFEQVTPGFWIPRIALSGTIPLSDLQPGGQDDPGDPQFARAVSAEQIDGTGPLFSPFYDREPVLLLPVVVPPAVPDPNPPIFTANLLETSAKGQNQHFAFTVDNGGGGTGGLTKVLIIDRNPFMVALAVLPNLASVVSGSGAQIAQWSNIFPEGPGWRVSAGAGSFQLYLPPQGVGEAMVTSVGDDGKPRNGEPSEGDLVDFRLTPPAQAVLQPSEQVQLFAEPGWNLRRLLGYPGEQAPGSAVNSMQFESFYGLTCSISADGLHMSEMFSRLGGFAGPLVDGVTGSIVLNDPEGYTPSQQDQYGRLNKAWAGLYNQLLSRFSILELWNQLRGFDLQLVDGVSYQLRDSSYSGANSSFAGGLAHALDVENLLTTVQSNPKSTAAVLFSPRFSPLGAYGRQRATFANGNIIIECDVAMGWLDSLSVTVIGRIGNFWHHAKHVTIYQRSVRPSRQFYLEQPLLEGRPIVRKVSEYIEILQKTRSYPESGSALGTGCVQGAEFKSIRINVDGNWGSSVGPAINGKPSAATRIPLWRRDAIPADVYPRPHLLVQLATDSATGNDSIMAEVLDPEKLYFYSDPSQPTAITDNWPAVNLVDFCINTLYRSTTGQTPQDFTVEPGFGRFTYSIGTDASQVNIVSQRTPTAVASALRSVHFMRSLPLSPLPPVQPPTPAELVQQSAGRLHDFVNNTLDELVIAARTATANPVAAVNGRLNDLQNSLVQPLSDACAVVKAAPAASICSTLATLAGNAIQSAAIPVSEIWESLFTAAQAGLVKTANNAAAAPLLIKQAVLNDVDTLYLTFRNAIGPLISDVSTATAVSNQLTAVSTGISADLDNLEASITDTSLASNDFRQSCEITLQRCQGDVAVTLDQVQQLIESIAFLLGGRASGLTDVTDIISKLSSFSATLSVAFAGVLSDVLDQSKNAAAINADIDKIKLLLPPVALEQALGTLNAALASIGATVNPIPARLATLRDTLRAAIGQVTTTVAADYVTAITNTFNTTVQNDFDSMVTQLVTVVQAQVVSACGDLLSNFTDLTSQVEKFLSANSITTALGNLTDPTECAQALEDLRTSYLVPLDSLVQQCQDLMTDVVAPTSSALTLLRAFGAPPVVPGLSFGNTSAIAYFYNKIAQEEVQVSAGLQSFVTQASSALSNAAGDQLHQLGISGMPTGAVFDSLVPGSFANLQLSDLFPNIAGLSLSNLFSGVKMPQLGSDQIHITHNVDPQTLRASLDVTVNFPIATSFTPLFSIGPATVTIDSCIFQADVHVSGAPGQNGTRTSSGSISGNWHVLIGGTEILAFVNTSLSFDEAGHLHFDIAPARVRLAAVLQFLAELVEGLGLGGGFTLNLLPTGIECLLELPFPDMSGGAFGISNLSLGCHFQLNITPEFQIVVGANLGLQEAPFTLTIFVLGGAGWFESNIIYTPATGKLSADVSIGILASASLSISLGPISGGVFIYFGITAEFHSGGGGLDLGILLMIQGRVSLLGIVDVDITLLMEAEYTSGGGLIGRGEVDVSIKICWCFTLDVHKSVEFTFGSSSSKSSSSSNAIEVPHAEAFLAVRKPAFAAATDPTPFAQATTNRINFLT